jgi:hypothetical protein
MANSVNHTAPGSCIIQYDSILPADSRMPEGDKPLDIVIVEDDQALQCAPGRPSADRKPYRCG